ncbi:MAG: FmdB family zinc ribbon protein [Steroidobacteraceae bacterium]
MPTYQYLCTQCGQQLEVVQSFSDASLTVCPNCSGALRKVFGSVGVVFKGSGFYRNDSRESGKSESSTPAKSPTASGDTATSGTKESSTKAESKSEGSKKPAKAAASTAA